MAVKFQHLISQGEKWKTLPLYEAAFPEDQGDYANYYYEWKCRDNEVLVLADSDNSSPVICSMLHLNPYRMWVSSRIERVHYIVAVATALPYRRQGYMRMLLKQAFQWLYQQKEPFTYLMPANRIYYEPFGFRVIYDQAPVSFPEEIEEANRQIIKQYDVATLRDEAYMGFLEAEPDGIDTKEDGHWKPQIMCRIIHAGHFLECLRAYKPRQIDLCLADPLIAENNGWYRWQVDESSSKVRRLANPEEGACCLTISVEELAEQLFGVAPCHPALSEIKLLKRICINEEV